MLANMAISLIMHKRITTTVAKAKALKKYVEPLITKSKEDSTNSRRVVFSYLQNKEAIKELFGEVAQKVGDRPGGYTRIIKLGTRQGDAWQRIPRRSQPVALVSLLRRQRQLLLLRLLQLRRQRQRLPQRRLLLKRQRLNKQQTILYIESLHPFRCGLFCLNKCFPDFFLEVSRLFVTFALDNLVKI